MLVHSVQDHGSHSSTAGPAGAHYTRITLAWQEEDYVDKPGRFFAIGAERGGARPICDEGKGHQEYPEVFQGTGSQRAEKSSLGDVSGNPFTGS